MSLGCLPWHRVTWAAIAFAGSLHVRGGSLNRGVIVRKATALVFLLVAGALVTGCSTTTDNDQAVDLAELENMHKQYLAAMRHKAYAVLHGSSGAREFWYSWAKDTRAEAAQQALAACEAKKLFAADKCVVTNDDADVTLFQVLGLAEERNRNLRDATGRRRAQEETARNIREVAEAVQRGVQAGAAQSQPSGAGTGGANNCGTRSRQKSFAENRRIAACECRQFYRGTFHERQNGWSCTKNGGFVNGCTLESDGTYTCTQR